MKALVMTLTVLAGLAADPLRAQPLDTTFTYQGRLRDAGAPANGPYDFRFLLYDAPVGGSQVGPLVTRDDVVVTDGLFTLSLDFGAAAFTGTKRWLDISVRPGASTGAYTPLSERQEMQAAPHSAFSLRSPWSGIAGKPAGFADDIDNDALGGLTCVNGQVAKWNGTAWACASDLNTTYNAGAGLDLTANVFSVADAGVTTAKLANLGVSTPKLADGAVTSTKIADASVATADLANGAVTSSVIADGTVALADLGQNGCGPNQILKWNGAAWACAADLDTNSGGTVTTVGTGAGLTGGPITTTGAVSVATGGITTGMLANGAVTSPKIANGAVGLAQINTSEVQARVATTCPPGRYLKGINADGTVICEPFFIPNTTTIVDGIGASVGGATSIAIGADGKPVISYLDIGAGNLKVARCGNAACTAGNSFATVDPSPNFVGDFSSIAIGSDGLPIISYYDATAFDLKVVHCGNAACTVADTPVTFEFNGGGFSSIAIGIDGLPVIGYIGGSPGAVKVVRCGTVTCSVLGTPVVLDNVNADYVSLAIGIDGFPIISYRENVGTSNLKVAHCGNATCTAGNTLALVEDSANSVGEYNSIAIGEDGRPIISYYDGTIGQYALKVAHCGNVACTAGNVRTIVESGPSIGLYTSIVIAADGLPLISYLGNGNLQVVHCGNATCTSGNSISGVASGPGGWTSIAIGADGLPVISHSDASAADLKATKCATRSCQ